MKNLTYYLGEFGTITAVWERWPNGGIEGEYVKVDGQYLGWDKYTRRWETIEDTSSSHNCGCDTQLVTDLTARVQTNTVQINTLMDRIDTLVTSITNLTEALVPIDNDTIDTIAT